ncbi:hypothetical protein [Nocardia aurantiaca]|uniref:hypothetical protein n=1 Tax=Nocardia aurantiaca TaxID=2675850 RepID=UPI001E3D3200|nr:hypothetical protein [Nocardia aurantiaca]
MTTTHHPRPGHPDENLGEFAEELRLLAEAVLERVEPVLRRTAAEGRTEWSSCSWCPVCAAAAIVRGEHHDVVAAIAEHGTAIVTVLREALAGVPVDPVIPPDLDPQSPEYQAWHHHSHLGETDAGGGDLPFADAAGRGEAGAGEDGEFARGGRQSAVPGDQPAPGAGLAAVFARFLAGAQGRAAARNQTERRTAAAGAEASDDPVGPGTGAARRPGADGPEHSDTVPRTGFRAEAADHGQPFGPPVARPREASDRPAPGREATAPSAGRRGKRAKYTPIDVTIKA